MSVTAIIVTRGDVNLAPVLVSLPEEWEIVVWDNGRKEVRLVNLEHTRLLDTTYPVPDLSVYGRYAAIEYASNDLIYVQDDDCIVSNPRAIEQTWLATGRAAARVLKHEGDPPEPTPYHVVCNMPPEFRHDFYSDHALVGFGACFHRDAPQRAFGRFLSEWAGKEPYAGSGREFFERTCDVVFTGLTPRVLVDIPKTNLWWAEDESRMYRQPQHVAERQRMLELVRQVRDS